MLQSNYKITSYENTNFKTKVRIQINFKGQLIE